MLCIRALLSGLLARASAGRHATAAVLVCLAAQGAAAATPLEVVKTSNEAVLAIFKKHPVVDAAVEKELFKVIDGVTDYAALSAGAVEPFCPKLTAAQCATFKDNFTRLLRISSIRKLGRYRADSFEYGGEEIASDTALVRTFANYKDDKVPLDYQMGRRGADWVIVNYVVDGIDTIRNYRKQFTQLLAKETFDQVIARLERRIKALEAEK